MSDILLRWFWRLMSVPLVIIWFGIAAELVKLWLLPSLYR